MQSQKRDQRGFTLMELMVVIVIVAILAAVAVPLYINYVKDAQRTEAKGAVGAVITAEQTFFQRNGYYVLSSDSLNVDLSDLTARWKKPAIAAATGGNTAGFVVTMDGQDTNSNTKGLQVVCTYIRGQEPTWTEK